MEIRNLILVSSICGLAPSPDPKTAAGWITSSLLCKVAMIISYRMCEPEELITAALLTTKTLWNSRRMPYMVIATHPSQRLISVPASPHARHDYNIDGVTVSHTSRLRSPLTIQCSNSADQMYRFEQGVF